MAFATRGLLANSQSRQACVLTSEVSVHNLVIRPLYKNLLRLAQRYDKHPILKLHHTQQKTKYYNPGDYSCVMAIRSLFRRAILLNYNAGTTAGMGFEFYKKLNFAFYECEKEIPFWKLVPPANQFLEGRGGESVGEDDGLVQALSWSDRKKIKPGMLLVSHPMLQGYWARKVILILNHNYLGSVGIFLGQEKQEPVWFGGPLGRKFLVWAQKDLFPGGVELGSGLYWAELNDERSKLLTSVSTKDYRLYNGHAGWSEGQLSMELGTGCWFVAQSPSLNDAFFGFEKHSSDVDENIAEEVEAEEEHRADPLEDLLTGELTKEEEAHEETETKKTQFVIEGQEEERVEATATEPAPKRRTRRTKATTPASTESEQVKSEVPVQTTESLAAATEAPITSTVTEAVEQENPELASATTETQHEETTAASLLPELEAIPERLSACKDTERLWKKVVRMMGGEYALSLWIPSQKEDRRKTAYGE